MNREVRSSTKPPVPNRNRPRCRLTRSFRRTISASTSRRRSSWRRDRYDLPGSLAPQHAPAILRPSATVEQFFKIGPTRCVNRGKLNWSVSAFGNMALHATLNASRSNIAIRFDFNGARRIGCVRNSHDPINRSMKGQSAPSYANPNYCGFQSSDQASNTEPCSARIYNGAILNSASPVQAGEHEDLGRTFQRNNMVISIPYGPIQLHPFLRQAQTEYGETQMGQV